MDKTVKRKISDSVKPTITAERREKMSDSMKDFWKVQKQKDEEIKTLKKENRELKDKLGNS